MLSIHDLHLAYGPHTVLQGLNLSLAPGEIFGLIGPNGAGKSSLIRALSGVHKPHQGKIQINGEDLADLSAAQRARWISVVPQSTQLPPAFTVYECVALGRTPHLNWLGQLGRRDREKVAWALETTEMAALQDRRAGELSGGEQQRVLLARALAQDCPIVLLDEPTAHLDLHHQVAILNVVRQLVQQRQLAVVAALHDLNLAAMFAQRLALLHQGRLQAIGTPHEVLTEARLAAAYGVRTRILTTPEDGRPWVILQDS
ncbi:MAG: heme ABC transporter ATP-binding protein [Anaerolineales bacterium]|nr:heme ABC transporter ATP-binding protein [Anaerolineales bacterium]